MKKVPVCVACNPHLLPADVYKELLKVWPYASIDMPENTIRVLCGMFAKRYRELSRKSGVRLPEWNEKMVLEHFLYHVKRK